MSDPSLFKWRHFEAAIILCAVRWYLGFLAQSHNMGCPSRKSESVEFLDIHLGHDHPEAVGFPVSVHLS